MPYDKVVDSAVLESGLTSIANAIREKAGTSDALAFPAGFAEAIAAIQAGGGGLYPMYYKEVTFAEDMASTYTVDTSDCPFDPETRKTSWVVWQKDSGTKGLHIGCVMTSLYGSTTAIRSAGSGRTLTGTSTQYKTSNIKQTENGLNIEFTGSSFAVAAAGTTYAILGIKLFE